MLISVIIICFNQKKQIATLLKALSNQTLPADEFEVVVVEDGSTIKAETSHLDLPFHFVYKYLPRCIESCRARTRNEGAKLAKGEFLVFLDGDTLPNLNLLAQYKNYFSIMRNRNVVLGTRHTLSQAVSQQIAEEFNTSLLERIFENPSEPDGRLAFSKKQCRPFHELNGRWLYFFSCNFCIRCSTYNELNGFNASFLEWGMEDTEFGYRLVKAGNSFDIINAPTAHLTLPSRIRHNSPPYHSWLNNLAKFYEIHQDGLILLLLRSDELMYNSYMLGKKWDTERSDVLARDFFELCEKYGRI